MISIWFLSSQKKQGFSLVEVIVAIGLLTTAVVGLMFLTVYSLKLARIARQQLVAANLAQEGVEIVRALRDQNWLSLSAKDDDCISCPCAVGSWREGLCNESDRTYELDYTASGTAGGEVTGPLTQLIRDVDGFYSYAAGTLTEFRREIRLSAPVSAQQMHVSVTVFWCPSPSAACSGTEKSITVQDELYNWYGFP